MIAPRSGLPIVDNNWLAGIEREVAIGLTPTEFAARATSISLGESRAALGQIGVELPTSVSKASLSAELKSLTPLTEEQIKQYLEHVRF